MCFRAEINLVYHATEVDEILEVAKNFNLASLVSKKNILIGVMDEDDEMDDKKDDDNDDIQSWKMVFLLNSYVVRSVH